MSAPTISVVITTFETWPLVSECVGALRRLSPGLKEIVVVDDGSSSGPPASVAHSCVVVRSPLNRGYARSVNTGFARASGDVVLLLDSDALPLGDVVEPLRRRFEADPRLGAVGIPTCGRDGRRTGSSQPEPTLLGFVLGQRAERFLDRRRPTSARTVFFSCAIAIRRAAFDAVGALDEGFDFLDADLDLSMRLQDAGWKTAALEGGLVQHEGGGSPQTTSRRVLRFHFNRLRLLAKHGRVRHPALVRTVLFARHLVELVAVATVGPLLLPRGEARRKVETRLLLLGRVWRDYRPESAGEPPRPSGGAE